MDARDAREHDAIVKARTLLELGRISNLPTVWSNVFCGAALSGAAFGPVPGLVLGVVASLFYEGGMFLNDAFDAELDAVERPERPIPSGRASLRQVLILGWGLLAAGLVVLGLAATFGVTAPNPWSVVAGLVTVVAIVVYDRWHKGHAWSPVVMGLCRASLYAMAALAVGGALDSDVLLAALGLLLYVLGLTHVARFETGSTLAKAGPSAFVLAPFVLGAYGVFAQGALAIGCFALALVWSLFALSLALRGGRANIIRSVVSLIAGISLVDAMFIAYKGALTLVPLAFGAFLLTLVLQRRIRGT
jgi:4-hydroxybenzoate polyprenyltransferase